MDERLVAFCAAAREDGRLALDTEFMGEGRYRTLLCLIQLAAPGDRSNGGEILLLDPLAEDFDAGELPLLFADPAVEIVVHAGRQDIALLRRTLGAEFANVFDTQVAAGFAGFGAQTSYENLLRDVLSVRLPKTASFTRWNTRPLTAEQLEYARGDVEHLLELAAGLETRLRELGRVEWAREECEPLASASDERDVETILRRLPRSAALSPPSRAVARSLVEWRERTAERQDRPVQTVLADPALVEIARRMPRDGEQLERIRGAGAPRGSRARAILEAVERGRERPPEPTPERTSGIPGRPQDAPLIALGEALLRSRALEAGLAYELLATRADLQAIVAGIREGVEAGEVRTLTGWRRELAGEELLELLRGDLSLVVDAGPRGARVDAQRRG